MSLAFCGLIDDKINSPPQNRWEENFCRERNLYFSAPTDLDSADIVNKLPSTGRTGCKLISIN